MLMAKQIDSVIFSDNHLFIQEEASDDSVLSEMVLSGAGTHIVFETEILTPYITLDSGQWGWVTDEQRIALIALSKQLGGVFTLTYDDDTTTQVRFAKEKRMEFTPLFEGSCDYTALIHLAKII